MLLILLKIIIPSIIVCVWLLRQNISTPFRAGMTSSLQEEFAFYGLSKEIFYITGLLKLSLALTLFTSLWVEQLTTVSSIGIAIMMISAFFCHVNVRDKFYRSIPSLVLFTLSVTLLLIA